MELDKADVKWKHGINAHKNAQDCKQIVRKIVNG